MKVLSNTAEEVRKSLEKLVRASTTMARQVFRARIILLSLAGYNNPQIAKQLKTSLPTVRKWINRFNRNPSLGSLDDAHRTGRPYVIPAIAKCELIKFACCDIKSVLPDSGNVWTIKTLQNCVKKTTGFLLSRSEICRLLNKGELKPQKVNMWLHSPDPHFQEKVTAISSLYLNPPPNVVILCIDEKSGMQALQRRRSISSYEKGCSVRLDYEYIRHGTQSLIASFEVKTGKVFGDCGKTRKKEDIRAFMEKIALRYPMEEVYIIWDNLNIHTGYFWYEFNKRHGDRFHFIYTPVHGSWINQIEIWFGILQRKVLKNGSFTSEEELRLAVLNYLEKWNNEEAHPFKWKFRGYVKKAA